MAESSERKSQLIAELARSRAAIGAEVGKVRYDLDVSRRMRESIVEQKTLWLTGAAMGGWLLARLPGGGRRKEKAKKARQEEKALGAARLSQPEAAKGGLLLALLSFAVTILKPVITRYATAYLSDWVDNRRGRLR